MNLHDKGYRYNESGRIGDLTPTQLKRIQLGQAVKADIEQRQHDKQMNQDSLSHDYDVTESRQEAFQ